MKHSIILSLATQLKSCNMMTPSLVTFHEHLGRKVARNCISSFSLKINLQGTNFDNYWANFNSMITKRFNNIFIFSAVLEALPDMGK